MQRAKIILLSIFAAITYGVLHDQVTAHLCVEYFTIAHPPLFHTRSPTILAFCWGVAATFWIGTVFGVLLALVSQSDGPPPLPITRLSKSVLILLTAMAASALLAGVVGFLLSRHSIILLPAAFAEVIPSNHHHRFMAAWFAHGASYLAGLAGGAFLILRIWHERGRPPVLRLFPHTKAAIGRTIILVALVAVVVYLRLIHS